jgi:hypothetical protein
MHIHFSNMALRRRSRMPDLFQERALKPTKGHITTLAADNQQLRLPRLFRQRTPTLILCRRSKFRE